MKHLPKHLRQRWRYIAVELETWPDADFSRSQFQRAVWYAAQNLIGDAGSAETDLSIYGFSIDRGRGSAVVRTRRGQIDRARAALACVTDVDGEPVGIRVRGVSGTVRACEEKYIRTPRISEEERQVPLVGADRSAVVRSQRIDARVGDGFIGATNLDSDSSESD